MEIVFRSGYTRANMSEETVGDIIRRERRAAGLTQRELADEIGFTDRSVSSWEKGDRKPSPEAAYGLARVFKISAEEILRRILHPEEVVLKELEAERQSSDDERFDEVYQIATALLSHPQMYGQWIGYGHALLRDVRDPS